MALDDVETASELEELAYFDADLMRQTLQLVVPDIDPPTGMLNMLAMDANNLMLARDADGETIVGANPANTLEAIEAGVMSALRENHDGDGPYDTNIRHVQETLNLILSGADGAIASIAAQEHGNGKLANQERERKRAQQAAADNVLRESTHGALAAAEEAGIPKELYINFSNQVEQNLSASALEAEEQIAESMPNGEMPESESEIDELEQNTALVATEIHLILGDDPRFADDMPPEDQEKLVKIIMAERQTARLLGIDLDELRNNPPPEAEEIQSNFMNSFNTMPAEVFAAQVRDENSWTLSNVTASNASDLTNLALRAYEELNIGETEAVELTQTDIDRLVVNFTMEYNDIDHLPVYVGTSLSEDSMSLINDGSSDITYFSVDDDGQFYEITLEYAIAQSPTHGAALADQIEGSGFQFNQLSAESIQYVAEMANVNNQQELLTFLRETDNSHPFVMGVMGDPYFMDTVGNYALESVIQAELERGQVFGNDPRLDDLLGTSSDHIIQQQQTAIDELIATRDGIQNTINTHTSLDSWILSYNRSEIAKLNDQIAEMETQLGLYEQTITAQAEAEADVAAAEAIVAEQGFGEAEVDRAKAEAAELEARAEQIAAGEYTMEDVIADAVLSKNSFLRVQAQHMNPDGMTNTDFEDMMNYSLVEQFPDGVPEEVMTALRERFEEHGGTFLTENAAAEIPQSPQPDSIQALLDNNPELNSYVLSLAEQTHIPESDLVAELESRGLSADEIEGVMRIAETQMAVNIAPRIDTVHVTHGTLPANRAPGEPASGTFNAVAAVAPEAAPAEPSPQTPAPEVMTREEVEIASATPSANATNPPMGMAG